jgi:LIVCS family branched-chain amino acid:cation transporter
VQKTELSSKVMFFSQVVFMLHSKTTNTIATGLAMFSMFFGAGNVVFPLAIGQLAESNNFYAISGLLLTAVGVPFAGLTAMTLYDGDYRDFFYRIGKVPGFIIILIIMALLGPLGALPRCIALSYSTMHPYLPSVSSGLFSVLASVVIYLFTFKRNSIIESLGFFLTPILLGSLSLIIIKGLINGHTWETTGLTPSTLFLHGLEQGYQTMDLLGAFFFCSVVLVCLKQQMSPEDQANPRRMMSLTFQASCLGAFLLSSIYIGFSYVAAMHSKHLAGLKADALISAITIHVLGESASIIVSVAVALACLTTAIALAAVFAEFIHTDITRGYLNYQASLIGTLIICSFMATLNFTQIAAFLAPILQISYPALIMLTIVNILYKLYGFKPVKTPVFLTFLVSLVLYFI